MKIKLYHLLTLLIMTSCSSQLSAQNKSISKNNMKVKWSYSDEQIHFTMEAPTVGWVTIGFNTQDNTSGAYLLMGRVINGKVEVVEHYTSSPGNYKPISDHGVKPQTSKIHGKETGNNTSISFSLPIKAHSKYQQDLTQETEYFLIMAYSRDDDFQHHSMMRTSVKIKL